VWPFVSFGSSRYKELLSKLSLWSGVELMASHPIGLEAVPDSHPASFSTQTVTVYTRHSDSCPKNGEPYWKRCH